MVIRVEASMPQRGTRVSPGLSGPKTPVRAIGQGKPSLGGQAQLCPLKVCPWGGRSPSEPVSLLELRIRGLARYARGWG